MKNLQDYITESEEWETTPMPGDEFDIELAPDHLIESYVIETLEDGIVIQADEQTMSLLEQYGCTTETIRRYGPSGSNRGVGFSVAEGFASSDQEAKIRARLKQLQDKDPDNVYKIVAREFGMSEEELRDALHDEKGVAEEQKTFKRMLELAGVADHKFNQQDDVYREDQDAAVVAQKELDTAIANPMPGVHEEVERDQSPVERAILHRILMQHPSMLQKHGPERVMSAVEDVADFVGNIEEIGTSDVSGWIRQVMTHLERGDKQGVGEGETMPKNDPRDNLDRLHPEAPGNRGWVDLKSKIQQRTGQDVYGQGRAAAGMPPIHDYANKPQLPEEDMDEAKYHGREVPLGKPMPGDVKKSKVYVRDPKTGNIKKVNFGHGGTSAKRAGQKTMKIKKSNPARRKSFRARHNCDNPGPRTKARYWSCRAW